MEEYTSSGFYNFISQMIEWFSRFVLVNLIWFFMNIPVLIILLMMVIHKNYFANMVILFFIIPPVFFPSSAALLATIRDWILKRPQASIWKKYMNYYKSNYRLSFQVGWIFTLILTIWLIDYLYFKDLNSMIGFLFLVLGMFLVVWIIYCLSYVVHYEMKLKVIIKNSLLLSISNPLISLLILLIIGSILYVTANFIIIFPFLTGSTISYFSFLIFHRQLTKLKLKET